MMPRCPYGKKGRHEINVLVPDDTEHPFVLFCSICGMTKRESVVLVTPMDDLPSDAIAQMVNRGEG
jgi:hypothetical protein